MKVERKKPWSAEPWHVSGWGCCIILYLYRSYGFFFRLSEVPHSDLVEVCGANQNTSSRAPGSTWFDFFSSVLCQIVNRQMEPFRWRDSCVNIRLGSVDAGVHKSDDHTWNEGSG